MLLLASLALSCGKSPSIKAPEEKLSASDAEKIQELTTDIHRSHQRFDRDILDELELSGDVALSTTAETLINQFGDDNLYVRRATVDALSIIGHHVVPQLAATLSHENPEFRYRASATLAKLGDPSRDALSEALKSRNANVRREAARALAFWKGLSEDSAPRLFDTLADEDPLVAERVVFALIRISHDSEGTLRKLMSKLAKDNPTSFTIMTQLHRLLIHEPQLKKIIQIYRESNSQTLRSNIVRAMGMAWDGTKSIPFLKDAISDPGIENAAALALFRLTQLHDPIRKEIANLLETDPEKEKYPGHQEDLILAQMKYELEGPRSVHHTAPAISAGGRIFTHLRIVGKTKDEVGNMFGDFRYRIHRANGEERIVYGFDNGFNGIGFTLIVENKRIVAVKGRGH